MKPLLPTLKETKRYVTYEVLSTRSLGKNAEKAVLEHLEATLGLFDGARAGIIPVRYDEKVQTGILRVNHKSVDKVRAALLTLQRVGNERVVPRVRGVSGILKKTARFQPAKRTIIKS